MKIRIKIHFLFYFVAFIYLISGRFYSFAVYTLCDILHELGHSLTAQRYGLGMGEIMLMPYGAVTPEKTDGLKTKDDIVISLGGPLMNLAVALFWTASWWFVPELYFYTDEIVSANLSLLFVNLLPAYSLDGGRIMTALLELKLSSKKAVAVTKVVSLALGFAMSGLFVMTCFKTPNISLLIFGIYLICSVFVKTENYKYVKITEFLDRNIGIGAKINLFAIDENATVKCLLNNLDTRKFNRAVIYSDNRKVAELDQNEIIKVCSALKIYQPVKDGL